MGAYLPRSPKKTVTFNPILKTCEPQKHYNLQELLPNEPSNTLNTYIQPNYITESTSHTPKPKCQRLYGPGFRYEEKTVTQLYKEQLPNSYKVSLIDMSTNPPVCNVSSPFKVKSTPKGRSNDPELNDLIKRLFDLESVENQPAFTPDELKAEESFAKTTVQLADGRYSVALPFKHDKHLLGKSRLTAIQRLNSLEKRLNGNPNLREAYNEFMGDYLNQGHLESCSPPSSNEICYYMPHHCVHRADDPPQKIRVVFNASQKTNSKFSLNDILLPGPKLQLGLPDVITRFRCDRFVFSADVRQMFRRIEHRPEDRDLLRIVWRFSPNEPIQDFRMKTVTYGTASAPFLANRVIRDTADRNAVSQPDAAEILYKRIYVDDVNGGGNTIDEAVKTRDGLIKILAEAKLELRKWSANDPCLLEGIPKEHCLSSSSHIDLDSDPENTTLKILGLCWNPSSDMFYYSFRELFEANTKRELLSKMARIFDPLGWLTPVTVTFRILFRQACQSKIQWDEPLPPSTALHWKSFQEELPSLMRISIPRYLPFKDGDYYLLGFADASEKAYACVLYLVTTMKDGNQIKIINAKCKVAPLQQISLPRLELCAAQLLARLIQSTLPSLPNIPTERIFAFSDSMITLAWLTADPAPVWKTFVGNRISETIKILPSSHWFYVKSEENPADCGSRGISPADLGTYKIWWDGPSWLGLPPENWPLKRARASIKNPEVELEARNKQPISAPASVYEIIEYDDLSCKLENKFSSFKTLRNVTAWCLRFIHNKCKRGNRLEGQLSAEEIHKATTVIIRRAQIKTLQDEREDAQRDRPKLKTTRILSTFMDNNDGVLRVGGRLEKADLPYETRHPALLPSRHPLTTLLIRHAHKAIMHMGPSATLAYLRHNVWIMDGKNVVRRTLEGCNLCFTLKPKPLQPKMGQLPKNRVTPISPFLNVGVDYAGPYHVRSSYIRNAKIIPVYLCIFVCFSTKAVHIEVATSLSTPAFLACYRNFCSRRGNPAVIHSDRGTNFVGASNELRRIQALLAQPEHQSAFINEAASRQTVWSFIPPRAPHFGGLWEAAVKSTKKPLSLALRGFNPTIEEFRSLTIQIEGILNSRPIVSLPSSPDDIEVLTPGHFLIFRPITAPPEDPDLTDGLALRSRWSQVQLRLQSFWKRWKLEYLTTLQTRYRWNTSQGETAIGTVVLLLDDNLPPTQWTLGRIIKLYPGNDGTSRVADVRTSKGVFQRELCKLCPLPTQ